MKNKIYLIGSAAFLLVVMAVIACSEERTNLKAGKQTEYPAYARGGGQFDVSSHLTVTKSTEIVTSLFFDMGIKDILTTNSADSLKFTFNTYKGYMYGGNYIDFKDRTFILTDEFLYEKEHPEYSISLLKNDYYIVTPEGEGLLDAMPEKFNDAYVQELLFCLHELISPEGVKRSFTSMSSAPNSGGCSIENTYYIFGIGLTTSAAVANLVDSINHPAHVNSFECRSLSTTTEITNWGGFYTATNTYCCHFNGSGGSW